MKDTKSGRDRMLPSVDYSGVTSEESPHAYVGTPPTYGIHNPTRVMQNEGN